MILANQGRGTGIGRIGMTLALLAVLAIGMRVVPPLIARSPAMVGGQAVIRDPDACYHLRRAGIIAEHGLGHALFDSYMNHPRGAHVIWPPLYDLALAGALRIFPGTPPGTHPAIALFPPLLFAGAVLVLFRFARLIWPARLGLAVLAAILPALLPASLPYTGFALLDHHAAELLWTAVAVAALGSGLARVAEGASPWRVAWAPGLALAGALLTQLSLVVLIALAIGAALVAPSGKRARALAMVAIALGLTAIVILPFGLFYARAGAPFRHFQFGLFQPALAGAAALAAAVMAVLAGGRRRGLALGFAIPLIALGLVLAPEIGGGLGYVGRQLPWLASIGESQPLFADGFTSGAREAMIQLSLLALLLPVAWVRLGREGKDARRRTLLLASLGFTALGLLQRRFLPHAALFVGFGAAVLLEPLVRKRGRQPVLVGLTVVLLAVALLPCTAVFRREEEPVIAFDRAHTVLDYLRTRTPSTAHFADPHTPAEYGVLAEWSFGHFIQYYGQRAAVTDNFGDHAGDPLRPRDFFLATEETKALAAAESLRVRYVLVRDLIAGFEGLVPDAEMRQEYLAGAVRRPGGRATIQFTPRIEPTLLYRLAWRYGSAFPGTEGLVPPLAHLRLVAESRETETIAGGSRVPYVKLYEIVPGAELRVTGLAPGELGLWLSAVRSPTGSRFPYVTPLAADSTGTIALTVPYPTVAAEGESRFDDGGFRIGREAERQIAMPVITEDDVRSGRTIAVSGGLAARSGP